MVPEYLICCIRNFFATSQQQNSIDNGDSILSTSPTATMVAMNPSAFI
jgi:hypothetical protein